MKKINLLICLTFIVYLFSCSDKNETNEITQIISDTSSAIGKDVNGKYYITKAIVGDMTLFDAEYNSNKELTKITTYKTNKYEVLKSSVTEKQYTEGKVTKVKQIEYAVEDIYNWIYNSQTQNYTKTTEHKKGDVVSTAYMIYEYSGDKISKIFTSETDVTTTANLSYSQFEYDASGNITKQLSYDSKGLKSEVELQFFYNEKGLLASSKVKNTENNKEQEMMKVTYDSNNNPTEVAAYSDSIIDVNYNYNYTTKNWDREETLLRVAGIYPVFKAKYDSFRKNFFGNTLEALVPQLKGIKINNAFSVLAIPNTINAVSINYGSYNIGGYPTIANIMVSSEHESYNAISQFEYIK